MSDPTDTIKTVQINQTGQPDVMALVDAPLRDPKPGEIRIRHKAIGVNFIDTYHRSGLYPLQLPSGIGLEAAGLVDALGDGVDDWRIGQRAAYATGPLGAYSEAACVPASRAVPVPDGIDDQTAAGALLKGMTAQFLLKQAYQVKPGQTVLFHAAAGGVGSIACQWAKHLGATVIGTAGSEEKASLAKAHGCDHVILYRTQNVADEIARLTDGKKVPVVYDGVGRDTFNASIDSLAPRGLLVSFGNASGPVTGIDLSLLATKGSLYITRPTLFHYTATPKALRDCAADVFDIIQKGSVKIEINQTYRLEDAVTAHKDLEARNTTGTTLLLV